MRANPQKIEDLFKFTKEILNEKRHFGAVFLLFF